MRCLACNKALSDLEASRKYINLGEIKNPEEAFIGLCTNCLSTTDLTYWENDYDNNESPEEDIEGTSNQDFYNN